ncbi:MAG: two-component sensor histidine kinase [Microbacterium sp.]|uniref:sensor histidine kinase n=1 Tax=Microbacterium sp. TaxID=51671 RepID=UPI001ACD1CE7|nr:ATP-binding protein [Microbacterium sp.]MBN9155174.1 two-component sensor histidine kinase [Microbacterium sp.]
MDTPQLALFALLVGVVLGGSVAAVVVAAYRARDRALVDASNDVPDGVRDVLAGMDDAAVVVDTSSTVVAASRAAIVFGMKEGTALPADELKELARTARNGTPSSAATLRLRRGSPPAEPRLVSVRSTAITPRLVLVIIRDITEQERVEEMRRDFVANTSHELKTPVGAVSLLAEAIESAADDPDQVRVFATRLQAEASRLASLTSRIMNLSRLQAADELTAMRDVAVDEIVASAVDAHAIQAGSAGVSIVRGGERGLYVHGDAQVLSEALGNLIANAVAYSSKGSSVGVGVKSLDDVVEVSVTDRGIGISEQDQQRIFERFYRADQARSRRTGGTGLGLSIVKHAVQRHGGEVRLWSRPGHGSTFTIRLPQVESPQPSVGRKKPKKRASASPRAKVATGKAAKTARGTKTPELSDATAATETSAPMNGDTA